MNLTNIEIYGILITVSMSIIVALTTKGKNKKVDWGTTFSWLLIGFLITSHINTRVEMSKTNNLLEFYSEFKNNPSSVELARNEVEAHQKIEDSQLEFFSKIYDIKSTRFNHNLNSFKNIEISYNITNLYELGEMQNDVVEIFKTATPNTTVRATSYVNIDQWWTNEFGKEYSKVNKEAVDKGVNISRIWIFENLKDFENGKVDLEFQKNELGVKTYYLFEQDIHHLNEQKIDVIIIDNKINNKSYYGQLELTPLRKMTSVSFASNNNRLAELNKYWNDLMKIAKEY